MRLSKIFNWKAILLLILLLTAVFRVWQLGDRPSGITNDESIYIESAYSIWKTGHDLTGKILPLSFTVDTSFSPVHIYLMAPFVGILGPSPFSGRILNAILGIADVFLIFLLVEKLLKNKKIALISAFVMAFSPWHLLITRSAYDVPVALFFYLLAIVIFLYKVEKGNILWSLPAFLLAFYSYHATKIFFVLFIPILLFVYKDWILKRKKEFYYFIAGIALILFSFVVVEKAYGDKRSGQVFFWTEKNYIKQITDEVDLSSRISSGTLIQKRIFNNKAEIIIRDMSINYLSAFNPENLFFIGDRSRITNYRGFLLPLFNPIETIFYFLGFAFLIKTRGKRVKTLMLSTILIAPLAGTLVDPGNLTYIFRGVMLLPFLSILIAFGIYHSLELIQKVPKVPKIALILIFLSLYVFFAARSFNTYYFQFSTFGGESWFRSSRQIAELVNNKKESSNIQIVTYDKILPIQIAIFNKVSPLELQSYLANKTKKILNVSFEEACSEKDPPSFYKKGEIYIYPITCNTAVKPTSLIINPEDGGVIWKIYEKS